MTTALPAAVQRKAEEAKRLINERTQPPANPASPPPAAPDEVAKLRADLATMKESLTTFGGRAAAAERRAKEAEERAAQAEQRLKDLEAAQAKRIEAGELTSLSADERQLVGPELLTVVSKITREVAGQEFDQRVKPLNERMDTFERQSEAAYWATLDEALPRGWNDPGGMNEDPIFIAWLNGLDPESGRTRFALLKQAEGARQGRRVVEIFRAFLEKREIGARQPNPQPSPSPSPSAADTPPEDKGGKKVWKRSEISAFYRSKTVDPKWKTEKGRAEAREIEQDLIAAQREGRIVAG